MFFFTNTNCNTSNLMQLLLCINIRQNNTLIKFKQSKDPLIVRTTVNVHASRTRYLFFPFLCLPRLNVVTCVGQPRGFVLIPFYRFSVLIKLLTFNHRKFLILTHFFSDWSKNWVYISYFILPVNSDELFLIFILHSSKIFKAEHHFISK